MLVRLLLVSLFFLFANCLSGQVPDALLKSDLPLAKKADTLITIANKYKGRGLLDSMNQLLQLAAPLVKQLNEPVLNIRYHMHTANYFQMKGQYSKVIEEGRRVIPLFSRAGNLNTQAVLLFLMGNAFRNMRQYDSALHYYTLTENKYELINPYDKWNVLSEKGRMYMEADNFAMAESYYQQAYALTRAKGIRMDHGVMLTYLLGFYNYSKQPEKYAAVLTEQIDFRSKGPQRKGNDLNAHTLEYKDLANLPLTEKVQFLESVKRKLLEQGQITNGAYTNSAISAAYEENNQPEKSIPYMRENLELTKAPGQLLNHFIYGKAMYRLLMKAGKPGDANEMFDYLFKLKDSISNSEQGKKLQELEVQYQTEKKEQQIELLSAKDQLNQKAIEALRFKTATDSLLIVKETEKRKALFRESLLKEMAYDEQLKSNNLLVHQNLLMDSLVKGAQAYSLALDRENDKQAALAKALDRENNLKASQLKKERAAKWALAGGASLLLLSGLGLLHLYRRQKSKNAIIEKQSADLEVLMKEIHHRVKNNLQVISSLLDLQSMTIADNQASEAVKEGKNRVQSMALIHQNLYSEGNIKGIRTKEYISNLLSSLCDSYNITNDKVKINTQIDDLNLDVDTMIPLGLVLNELVSNSLKYAFPGGYKGELSIQLRQQSQHLLLKVKDNGQGYPEGLNVRDGKSFGMKMIRAFAQKLKAKLDVYNDNGAVVEMQITKYKLA